MAVDAFRANRGLKAFLSNLASKIDILFTGAAPQDAGDAPKLDFNTQLAVERTLLAHERTLMAWVRTAASLISFGFTIYKFFQLEAKGHLPSSIIGPRTFASLMILMGIFALVIATLQHHQSVTREKSGVRRSTLAGWVAGLISLLGLLAIISVIFDL